MKVLDQKAVQLVVSHQKIDQQQLRLELERTFGNVLPLRVELTSDFFPESFDFLNGGPQCKDAVVLGKLKVVVEDLNQSSEVIMAEV